MTRARRLLMSAFFLIVLASARINAQHNGTLSGSVVDNVGAAVPNSPISLRWNDLGDPMSWDGVKRKRNKPRKKELTVYTDTAGRISVSLLPGAWDVFAYHDGFVPVCQVVGIETGEKTSIELRFPRPAQTTLE